MSDDITMEPPTKRGPGRPPNRPAPRPAGEDHKARAAARLAEIRATQVDEPEYGTTGFFGITPDMIPDGWSYEGKAWSVFNKEDPQYMSKMYRANWTPVPASRHPELLYKGYVGDTIIKDGIILMERPAELTVEARRKEMRNARSPVEAKEKMLGAPALPLGDLAKTPGRNSRHIGPVEIGAE